jgi:uncharacterized membrane protein YbhN (UPF0104 family)
MRKFTEVIGQLLCLAALVYVVRTIYLNMGAIVLPQWSYHAIITGVVLLMVNFIQSALMAYAWMILLHAMTEKVTFKVAYSISGITQIAKYLPGNVFHYAGRVVLGKREGVPYDVLIVSLGVETIIVIASAAVIMLSCFIYDPWLFMQVSGWWGSRSISSLPVMLIITVCMLATGVIVGYRGKEWFKRLVGLNTRFTVWALALYVVIFVLHGVVVQLILHELFGTSPVNLSFSVCGFTVAVLAGFIIPGAPGGIGIRETVLISLFGSSLGIGNAAMLATILRIVTTTGEVIFFAVAWWCGRNVLKQGTVLIEPIDRE